MNRRFFISPTLRTLAAMGLLFFFAGCAYLESKQGEWIFNPVQGEWRGYRGPPPEFHEHWIAVGTRGERLHAWWSPVTDASAPVLLYLHGARWNLSGSVTRIPRWNRMGFSVLAIDYRGFGKSVALDGVNSEQRANEDAEAAWTYLANMSPSSKRFIFGHSLGGAMATHLAIKYPDADGLILEGSFTSVPDMIKETRWGFLPLGFLVTQRFNNIDRINEVTIPVLVAHGTADEIVPFSMGERLFAAARAPKRFLRAEGGSHHNLTANFFDDYRNAVFDLFKLDTRSEAKSVPMQSSMTSATAVGSAPR